MRSRSAALATPGSTGVKRPATDADTLGREGRLLWEVTKLPASGR